MAGVSSVLNIAKEALLAHQLSVQVASHNIANVDTPGYTRQTLSLATNLPTPLSVGNIGNGVHGEQITRQYDAYMTQRIAGQNSTLSNLEAQQEAMRTVETVFNEAPGLALNDLMSQFWESWQKLGDNPEILASRQSVVQQGQLLYDHLQNMNAEITQARYDIGVNMDTAVGDINSLTAQIAKLNVEVTNSEGENRQANDLRDQRDELVKQLSGLVDIKYFENSSGSYTVLLADGHSLVDTNQSWDVRWGDNKLYWESTAKNGQPVETALGDGLALGGKVGGWLEVRGQLLEGDPNNYLGRLDALANSLVREVNQQFSQGAGLLPFSQGITGTEMAGNAAVLATQVDATTANQTISDGTFTINGRSIGRIDGAVAVYGLAMGKAYNAATAITDAVTGTNAKLTTLVAGKAASGLADGESASFTVNGISVDVTNNDGVAWDAATTASNVVEAINNAISTYNSDPDKLDMTIKAVVGDTTNGGAANSIVLYNTVAGDESNIVIDGVDATDAAESKLGLTNGTYTPDETHNTGALTLFSTSPMTIKAGTDDTYLDQLGMGGAMSTTTYADSPTTDDVADGNDSSVSFLLNGTAISVNVPDGSSAETAASLAVAAINAKKNTTGVEAMVGNGLNGGPQNAVVFRNLTQGDTSAITVTNYTVTSGTDVFGFNDFSTTGASVTDDTPNDGKLVYDPALQGSITASLQGLDYADQLKLDGTSLGIWLYDANGTPVLPQAVNVSLERAYTLNDVASAINSALKEKGASGWLTASVENNCLRLAPDSAHQFAFANDTTNFLQAAGVNTFFSGHSAGTFAVNDLVAKNLDYVNAGQVSDSGEIFTGDNSNALLVSNIQQKEDVSFTGSSDNTLDGFYNSLVADIGSQGRSIDSNVDYATLVLNQMSELRDQTSGVSLDEEMANLIKFQQAYSAAAKLISSSDEMLKTLLESVGI